METVLVFLTSLASLPGLLNSIPKTDLMTALRKITISLYKSIIMEEGK